jgi:hypothetical protein
MGPLVRTTTWLILALGAALALAALTTTGVGHGTTPRAAFVFALVIAGTGLLGRPLRFEVDERALRIVWPLRSRQIQLQSIQKVELISGEAFRRMYGLGVRIGIGGLWGSFGLLRTARETFSMWVSRSDRYVLVRVEGSRALLITPAEPEEFIASLARGAGIPLAPRTP